MTIHCRTSFVLLALLLTGCQSGTCVVVPRSHDEVSAVLRDSYAREAANRQPGFEHLSNLKEAATSSGTRFSFTENFDKIWGIETVVTIEPRSAATSRVTIFTEYFEPGFLLIFPEKTRREDIEGQRMAQLLRWTVPDAPVNADRYEKR